MNEKNPKAQIASKVKDVTNVLVTVSRNPSVDELSAALALTFMLDKVGKHATAVFSGEIPPAIQFLEPEKTFEDSTSSLRDFIISLDKEKADRLRYKVDGDLVKIFITPYKTTISEKDLEFSEGDFNVELVIALGVDKKDELDEAIASHGRILHDATVATLNLAGNSTLGSISWADATASSYSELVASLGDALQDNILDEQIATAILTGVVSATDQFRNEKTSPKVMTLSAQLMAAGANQQLIATKLAEEVEVPVKKSETVSDEQPEETKKPAKKNDGSLGEMSIDHDEPSESDEETEKAEKLVEEAKEDKPKENVVADGNDALAAAEAQLSEAMEKVAPPAAPDVKADLEEAAKAAEKAAETSAEPTLPKITPIEGRDPEEKMAEAPAFDSSISATTAQAAHDAANLTDNDRNKPILSHGGSPYLLGADPNQPAQGADTSEPASVDPFASRGLTADQHTMISPLGEQQSAPKPPVPAPTDALPSLDDLQAAALSVAQPASDSVVATQVPPVIPPAPDLVVPTAEAVPVAPPMANPTDTLPPPAAPAVNYDFPDLPPPPPIPDFSQMPPALPDFGVPTAPVAMPAAPTNTLAPDLNVGLPPAAPVNPLFPSVDTTPEDPGQFKIPT